LDAFDQELEELRDLRAIGSVALLAGLGCMFGVEVPGFLLLRLLRGLAIIAGQLVRGRAER
jgi:hypothetical protein